MNEFSSGFYDALAVLARTARVRHMGPGVFLLVAGPWWRRSRCERAKKAFLDAVLSLTGRFQLAAGECNPGTSDEVARLGLVRTTWGTWVVPRGTDASKLYSAADLAFGSWVLSEGENALPSGAAAQVWSQPPEEVEAMLLMHKISVLIVSHADDDPWLVARPRNAV